MGLLGFLVRHCLALPASLDETERALNRAFMAMKSENWFILRQAIMPHCDRPASCRLGQKRIAQAPKMKTLSRGIRVAPRHWRLVPGAAR
jgi:hypothetical protein